MHWYEAEIKRLKNYKTNISYDPSMIFYGSSTFTLWKGFYEDFQAYQPVNFGFGGSTLEACVYFYRRIMESVSPSHFVIYAGDNDLGDGKSPETVCRYFEQLCSTIRGSFENASITYISIKPSLARWNIDKRIRDTNAMIRCLIYDKKVADHFVNIYDRMIDRKGYPRRNFYAADGLHLSQIGYALWKEQLLTHFSLYGYDKLTD